MAIVMTIVMRIVSAMISLYDDSGIKLLNLEMMRTREAQMKGLQYVDVLDSRDGLLFPSYGGAGYHMRNVKFAIDIAYIDDAGKILKVDTIEPETGTSYAPTSTEWAVETNAGFWSSKGYGAGSIIYFRGM